LRLDLAFAPRFEGHLYAQPLYWKPPGRGTGVLIVASESNTVAAMDAASGKTLWSRSLGAPAALSAFPCGNIDPLGITGTPVIDAASGTLYLDAMVADVVGPRHRLYALSLDKPADRRLVLPAVGRTSLGPHWTKASPQRSRSH
jgi:outer membrane protein assembly factor BamB